METRRSMGWVVPVLLASVLLTGCGDDSRAVEANGVTVLVAGDVDGASTQRLAGTLRVIDGCLGLQLAQNQWIAVFPAGTEVADDGQSVTLSDGSELRVGDEIEASGDTYDHDDPVGGAPEVPEQCGKVSAALLNEPRVIKQVTN